MKSSTLDQFLCRFRMSLDSCSKASCQDESAARADLNSSIEELMSTDWKVAVIRSEEWEVGMDSDEADLVEIHSVWLLFRMV